MSMPFPRAGFAVTTVAFMLAGPAMAASFKLDDGIDGAFDTQITAGVGIRTGNASCILVGDPTACGGSANTAQGSASDNGDLNYKAGQAFTGYLKATNELLLHKPDVGLDFMARATYFYDPAAESTDRTKLYSGDAQVVYNFQLLDLWAGKKFSIGDRDWRIRVGNQVINWGESYFFFGGINATNAIDFQKSLIPGAQIKEYVLPSPIVSLAGEVADGVNVEGYYQFGWVPNRYPAANSYWSAADFIGRGNTDILTLNTSNFNALGLDAASILHLQGVRGLISRGQLSAVESQILAPGGAYGEVGAPILTSRDPYSNSNQFANQGQFGLSAHYKPSGSTIDLGLYYLHYFDHSPVLSYVGNPGVSAGVDVQARYLANRDLIGASTNFPVGPWAIGGELSVPPARCGVAVGMLHARTADRCERQRQPRSQRRLPAVERHAEAGSASGRAAQSHAQRQPHRHPCAAGRHRGADLRAGRHGLSGFDQDHDADRRRGDGGTASCCRLRHLAQRSRLAQGGWLSVLRRPGRGLQLDL